MRVVVIALKIIDGGGKLWPKFAHVCLEPSIFDDTPIQFLAKCLTGEFAPPDPDDPDGFRQQACALQRIKRRNYLPAGQVPRPAEDDYCGIP